MPDSSVAEATQIQKLSYDGRIGALYWIFIKIILLNMITLTIYRFWGKTRLRSYVWSHMTLQGERFEYTGTGIELFLGALLVGGLVIVTYAVVIGIAIVTGEQSALAVISRLIFPLAFLYLAMVAIYAAQRYRLTRTLWRGIRGGMSGSAWTFGLRALGYSVVNLITFGLATPWTQMRIAEQRFNNSYFGDAKASLQARSGPVYGGFLLGFAAYVILMGLLAVTLYRTLDLGSVFQAMVPQPGEQPDPERMKQVIGVFFLAYLLFLVGAALIGVFSFSWYAAAYFKALTAGLRFDNLTFRSTMGAWDYFRFWFGNILIVAVTFGIGFPVAVHRGLKFFANRLEVIGEIDVERLKQNTLPKPKTGEGMLETFDTGFW